jgi:hypothetical protein
VGDNFQARVALAFSPLDVYRASQLTEAAESDCARHELEEQLRDLFTAGVNQEMLQALRAQAAYLATHRAQWREIVTLADARLKAGVIMLFELHELRRYVWALERKLVTANTEIARLEAQAPKPQPPSAARDPLIENYLRRARELDRTLSHLRSLDAWGFKFSGGVIPTPGRPVDWYGIVEVGYGLGGIGRNQHEDEYLSARHAELTQATYELPARADQLRKLIATEIGNARLELDELGGELAAIANTRAGLENADVPQAEQARSMLIAEELLIESDRVYYNALLDALTRLREKNGKS